MLLYGQHPLRRVLKLGTSHRALPGQGPLPRVVGIFFLKTSVFSKVPGTIDGVPTQNHVAPASCVSSISKDLPRANAATALNVADALEALDEPGVPPKAAMMLLSIIDRADELRSGVPVSVASRLLGVSEPTVRAWIDRGVLTVCEGLRPVAITSKSLGTALRRVRVLRDSLAKDSRLLDYLADRREWSDVSSRWAELNQRVDLDPNRIEEQLFK